MARHRGESAARRGTASRWAGRDGFTLLETLVAFVVLAVIMLVVQRGAVGSVNAAVRAKLQLDAGLVARTLLASPTLGADGQPASGRMNGLNWSVRFEALPIAGGAPASGGGIAFRPMRMVVDVRSNGRGGALSADAVRLVRVGPAAGG